MSNTGFGTGTPSFGAVNYGSDLDGVFDLTATMSECSGIRCLVQALARRIITPRGTLIDDPNYGYDLRQHLNDDLSPSDVARIGAQVDAEFLKDERVSASQTVVTLANNIMTVTSVITPSAGPAFTQVIAVTAVTVAILQPGL